MDRTSGNIDFYVDNTLYYAGYENCDLKVDQTGVLYVPEGTADYAAHVEDRVNPYLGDSGCSADVENLSLQVLTEMLAVAVGSLFVMKVKKGVVMGEGAV